MCSLWSKSLPAHYWSPLCTIFWPISPLLMLATPVFSYYSWGSQGKSTEVVCHSLLQWTTFCQTSPTWPIRLGWPHLAWLTFIELRLWSVWSDWLIVCDCVFSLSALWCSLSVLTILLAFLLPWTWHISSQLLQWSAATAPCLGRGVYPFHHHPWMWFNYICIFMLCCA